MPKITIKIKVNLWRVQMNSLLQNLSEEVITDWPDTKDPLVTTFEGNGWELSSQFSKNWWHKSAKTGGHMKTCCNMIFINSSINHDKLTNTL